MSSQDSSLGEYNFYSTVTSTKPLPSNPSLRADIEHVLQHGYVILPNCFTKTEAKETRDEIGRLLGREPLVGRNPFEGLATNRIYSLLNKSRVFDKLSDFSFPYHLDQSREKAQTLHHDDGYIQVPRPRLPFGAAIMVAFNEYTAENGATRIIPGSHTWDSVRRGQPSETIPALVPEGGVVYFLSTLWHGGGANSTTAARQSATVQYCQPYIRPIENQILAIDPRKLDQIDPRLVDMCGYRVMAPFMGYADGMNPRRASKRMVRWLGGEVEWEPPTFAHEEREAKL